MDVRNDGGGHEIISIKGILGLLMANIDARDNGKKVISLGIGDPTAYSCFYTTSAAQEAVVDALRSTKFNGYSPNVGLPQTRKALAEYLSRDLPYKLQPDDVYVTAGCTQAIEISLSILARPGGNILLPRPGFPIYGLCATFRNLEVRYFDLLPEKQWEVDLSSLEKLADSNTVAMVIINPGNPCGNVYTYQHLKEVCIGIKLFTFNTPKYGPIIAETAKRLGIVVIADEVYGHLAFGANPFVPMGVFGSVSPVITLGSMSKRWLVPGWRLGWLVTNDPDGSLKSPKAAVPTIVEETQEVFFKKTINILKQASEICLQKIREIDCISCPSKPEGSMAFMEYHQLFVPLLRMLRWNSQFGRKPGAAPYKDYHMVNLESEPIIKGMHSGVSRKIDGPRLYTIAWR
ncbi:hypothetical protein DH2020_031569 [Rehmannia glutinosa]|uniref:Aminotransferase class I/classII large domain-containing protein n=1 Tax=Rehmannia glutinosa TaxID=99300 RepID=A0ABR0VL05_REHGL